MKILAIETCYGKFSVGIYDGNQELAYYEHPEHNKQAELLVPSIEKILAEAGLKYQELDAVACAVGPGSFTGLRIGIAAAKGIVLATGIKAIGISSLQAAALDKGGGKVYLPCGNSDAYHQEFDADLNAISEPSLILGYGQNFDLPPNARLVAKYANLGKPTYNLSPLYVRKPDAKLPNTQSH